MPDLPPASASYPSWEYGVLQDIGAPFTTTNLLGLHLWAQSEGVDPRNNNWLATTLKGPNYPTSGVVAPNGGNAVMAYASEAVGVHATAATIRGFPAIVAALKAGNSLTAIYSAINGSLWCKGCQRGKYPIALAAWIGGGNPALAGQGVAAGGSGITPAQAQSAATAGGHALSDCAWKVGPFCVFNYGELKALAGGAALASGVLIMGAGMLVLVAFGLTGTRGGSQATNLATRIPGPVGGAARAVRATRGAASSPAPRRRSGGASTSTGSSSSPGDSAKAENEAQLARARHAARPGSRRRGGVPAREAIRAHKADAAAGEREEMRAARASDRRSDALLGPGANRRRPDTSDLTRRTP